MQAALPPPNTPFVDEKGILTNAWFEAINAIFKRTGGGAQDLIDQSLRVDATGIVVSTAPGEAITRAIAAGTGINVANGDGVGGNPTVTLPNTAVTPASYGDATHVAAITVDHQGRLTAAASTMITATKLGNAYMVTAPAATGYITVQDSTGTTYKILVST